MRSFRSAFKDIARDLRDDSRFVACIIIDFTVRMLVNPVVGNGKVFKCKGYQSPPSHDVTGHVTRCKKHRFWSNDLYIWVNL